MLSYLKENGFPMTIHFETSNFDDPKEGFKGYMSIVTDDNGNEIDRFTHKDYRARVYWAGGFFTALKLKNGT
jgi:hypothetical protein